MNLDAIEPLTSLGIALIECSDDSASFTVPMQGNQNDKGTLFAGSQYSGLVICGWYLASHWSQSQGLGSKVAIKNCNVTYPNAATTSIKTIASFTQMPDKRPSGHWRALIKVVGVDENGVETSKLTGDYRVLVE